MFYTCRLCGQYKDSKESDWDYWLDGVACEECMTEQNKSTCPTCNGSGHIEDEDDEHS